MLASHASYAIYNKAIRESTTIAFGTSAKMIKVEFNSKEKYTISMKSSEEIIVSDVRGMMNMQTGKFGKGLALGLLTLGYVILFFSIAKLFKFSRYKKQAFAS